MESAFDYSNHVVGKTNIGRVPETKAFANLILKGENVVIYEAPKTGKMSLIRQAFVNLKSQSISFLPIYVELLTVRSFNDFALTLADTVIRAYGNTPKDYARLVEEYLAGSHFVFDPKKFEKDGNIVSLNWDLDEEDIKAAMRLAYRIAESKNERCFLILNEFQNVMHTEDGEKIIKLLEAVIKEKANPKFSIIFCGSQFNAMHEIFGIRKFFFRQVERVRLSQIEPKFILEHINKGLLASGKVIDRDMLMNVIQNLHCNIWYISHFASICESLSRGYITGPIVTSAMSALVSIHEPRFISTMNDLTNYQVNLLKAILCGHSKLTSSEVIEEFGLNSSANVKRLREALMKKEIVDFSSEVPTLLDPLFEYWVKKEFFKMI